LSDRSHENRHGFLGKIATLFPGRERLLLSGVFAASVAAAIFETVGVASILPFMALVLDPSAISRYPIFGTIAASVGATTPNSQILVLGVVTALVVAVGNLTAGLNVFIGERFVARTHARLASSLFAGYLRQPYPFHVERDAPSLIKVVLNDVQLVVLNVISQALLAMSRGLMALAVLALLFSRDPALALTVMLVLGGAYAITYRAIRTRQKRLGADLNRYNLDQFRISQEGLGGIKELQVLGREEYVIQRFAKSVRGAARAAASNRATAQIPRYILETLAFGGILLITLALVAQAKSSAATVIPLLALYAFAGSRLMPALQQVFYSSINIRFALASLQVLHDDFAKVHAKDVAALDDAGPSVNRLVFQTAITLDNVSFAYDLSAVPVLRDINLSIRPNESIGLVGRTGAGKTTLADLILGLYNPTSGKVLVDGVSLEGASQRQWRRNVGYVPQQVFLANASIVENIAFGIAPAKIDRAQVCWAAQLAHADEFIDQLPDRYDTAVGERGVKLSGGQRQRLGIARALYHKPEVLVFDEATSALDGMTEDAVSDAIRSLAGKKTIILIAHRLRTVEACDRIILLEKGNVIADGPFELLVQTSQSFRRLLGRGQREHRERGA